jgi:acetate kinase
MSTQQLVLALNAGSSSVKASVLRMVQMKNHPIHLDEHLIQHHHILHALGERLGTVHATLCLDFKISHDDNKSQESDCEILSRTVDIPNMDHSKAIQLIIDALEERDLLNDIVAIGHRVVHGGTKYSAPILVDGESLLGIESISHLAPL